MKVGIVGGKLQGLELTYLAKELGHEVFLIDRNPVVPARAMADAFFCLDINENKEEGIHILKQVDWVIPAFEDLKGLEALVTLCEANETPLLFDLSAYEVTHSKKKSNALFLKHHLPIPKTYPEAAFPVVVKPSQSSGSEHVHIFYNALDLEAFLSLQAKEVHWIIEEFLEGPAYSIEVIGKEGVYITYEITEIIVDEGYDCKKVVAPVSISEEKEKQLREIAVEISRILELNGIMDLEVIDHHGVFKILEIDARFPSQTPSAVYHATGINLYEELCCKLVNLKKIGAGKKDLYYTVYAHFQVKESLVFEKGEHIMGEASDLKSYKNLWEADEVITNYTPERKNFVATCIYKGKEKNEVENRIKKSKHLLSQSNIQNK